jgi:UDP-N-acetylglucosamine--N-acetylmuramyl-(pentapeptide) pyrophosphoryl-undecaprenol N-acetylglucosamine transferase
MRVIISGGGTGGHIYPAITIAKALSGLVKPCEILFVGTKDGMEADIIPKEGFSFTTVEVSGFERKLSFKTIQTTVKLFTGLGQSFSILRRFKPDVVIGTGGYVCGPVLLIAAIMGIPTIIQEQNVIPGVTNRILARFVKKVAVGYPEAVKFFGKHRDKVVVTGNPIRDEVITADRAEALKAFSLDPGKVTLLVSGGSRGARSINNAMAEIYEWFVQHNEIQILHVTGNSEYNNIVDSIRESGIDIGKAGNISIIPYLHNMPQALAVADIAIFRAGAIALAELTALGIPAILIPYPYAAENHQEFNARVLENQGAAIVIRDTELTGLRLKVVLEKLLADRDKVEKMTQASKKIGRPEAAKTIAKIAVSLAMPVS